MITLRPLTEARVLIMGAGDLVDAILRNLKSYGVEKFTILTASTTGNEVNSIGTDDPQKRIHDDPGYFTSFDIILCANQPRPLEIALSDLRWPKDGSPDDPDLPMIVMRNAANTVKMRCQYRELLVNSGTVVSRFVSLPMELLPWTDQKRALVASTIRTECRPDQDPIFRAYLTAALAVINFQESHGCWPKAEDQDAVQSSAEPHGNDVSSRVTEFIQTFCTGGLASVPQTTALMAHLVTLDAIRLLTGNGVPVNNTNLDEVLRIVAESIKHS